MLTTDLVRQQAISALTDLNDTTFAEGGAQFTKFGIEYWSDPNNRKSGYINWVADQPVFRIDANTFSGDPTVNISDRLVPEEPMVRIPAHTDRSVAYVFLSIVNHTQFGYFSIFSDRRFNNYVIPFRVPH